MENRLKSLRRDAAAICRAILEASDARQAILRHVHWNSHHVTLGQEACGLPTGRSLWIIGAGKASASMAQGIEDIMQQRIAGGLIIVKYGHAQPLQYIDVVEAGHPLPDAGSVEATNRLLRLIQEKVAPDDLVLLLLSGGGSALLESPAGELALEDLIRVNELLLACGASIHEINSVRKHLSAVKGGQLARHLAGKETWSLILSDVPGDNLDVIASGPTVPDSSSFFDAWSVLDKYKLRSQIPAAVYRRIQQGLAGEIPDTPKQGDPAFHRQHQLIVGSNALACRAAATAAQNLGYSVRLRRDQVVLDNEVYAREIAGLAVEFTGGQADPTKPICYISGGETTVRLQGKGKGGRNQDLVLRCVKDLARLKCPVVLLSLGTDGTDGPTDAAGALADNRTLLRHQSTMRCDLETYIADNDSYHFFEPLADLIKTGPTGTNVMDVHLLLVHPC
jgi:glycerate 2-kinase